MKQNLFLRSLLLVAMMVTGSIGVCADEIKATLEHTAGAGWGKNTDASTVDSKLELYNNDKDDAWAGCAYAKFSFTIPAGHMVKQATLTYTTKQHNGKANSGYDEKIYYMRAGFDIDWDNFAGQTGTVLRYPDDRGGLVASTKTPKGKDNDNEMTIDATSAVNAINGLGQGFIVLMWTANNGQAWLHGKGDAEKAPTLTITTTVNTVAYLYGSTTEGDAAFNWLKEAGNYVITPIDVTNQTVSAESLQQYNVTVIGPSVSADNATVNAVKEAMPWTPVLNLNADMYAAWGYGNTVNAEPVCVVKDAKSALLNGIQTEEQDGLSYTELGSENVQAVILGDYFADDNAPLKQINEEGEEGDAVVAHVHNAGHNAYIYLPSVSEMNDNMKIIFANAVTMLSDSKSEITPTTVPVISQEYKNQMTLVTLSAGKAEPKVKYFYTIDGSTPTAGSTPYLEPVAVTAPCTFKAVAIAEGYTVSNVASQDITIYDQPTTPVISCAEEEGMTTVTLTCETPDADIWYSFSNTANDTTIATKYAEPFTIRLPQNITTFSVVGGIVFSELAQQRVMVKNPHVAIDVLSHFAAKEWKADNNPEGRAVANGKGMFSWGTSAVTMYTGEGTVVTDEETGDETIVYGPNDMREPECVNEPGENPQWVLKSRGTCMIWQGLTADNTNIGNDAGYHPSLTSDVDSLFPVTKNAIQFYKFQANETPNASIETISQYQAPFDVVVNANMQGGPLLVQVSADGTSWTTIGEIAKTGFARMWGKSIISYDGTDMVYVRLTEEEASSGLKVFDIYIANAGEKSTLLKSQLDEEYQTTTTGITTVENTVRVAPAIYDMRGVRRQSLSRGLNIIVKADGSVKKVIIK